MKYIQQSETEITEKESERESARFARIFLRAHTHTSRIKVLSVLGYLSCIQGALHCFENWPWLNSTKVGIFATTLTTRMYVNLNVLRMVVTFHKPQ